MTGRFLVCLALVSVLPGPIPGAAADDDPAPPLLAATDAAALAAAVGKSVVVRGKVIRTGKAKATGVNFLHFEGEFTVVVFGKHLKHFPDGEPAEAYKDQCVEVRGVVGLYKDKPQIELTSPAQIRIVDPEAVAEATHRRADPAAANTPESPKPDPDPEKSNGVDPRKYFSD